MTNETPVTNTVTRETTFVCGDCLMKAEYGEGNPDSMKNLPGDWYYIGHGWEEDDFADCDECTAGDAYVCEKADGGSSASWECPGCGVTGIMFNDTYMIEKAD